MAKAPPMTRLRQIMAALRHPETGCPWDIKQDFASIAPYAIEEAYEVADAIQRNDFDNLKNELGDLLLQIVFHAQMAEEDGYFDFDDVATASADKMERRHPHVFGTQTGRENTDWEDIKAAERAEENAHKSSPFQPSLMDDIPLPLPGLTRAVKIQKRAARVGFDWSDAGSIFAKLREETEEFEREMRDMKASSASHVRMLDELGDILFVVANLARHLKIDPEEAIRSTNAKFERRFRWMEKNRDLSKSTLEQMEVLWQTAKTDTG